MIAQKNAIRIDRSFANILVKRNTALIKTGQNIWPIIQGGKKNPINLLAMGEGEEKVDEKKQTDNRRNYIDD